MDKPVMIEVEGDKIGEITPFEKDLAVETLNMPRVKARCFIIDCPSKDAPEIHKIFYNGVEYEPVKNK